MHSTAAVMTTLLKRCNLSEFLRQLMPGIYQSPGWPRFIFHVVAHFELCFLHSHCYSFAQSEPFLHNEHDHFSNTAPHQGATRACSCDAGSELRLGGREKTRAKNINGMEKTKQKTCTSYASKFFRERTATSKIWPIRQWGGEANSNL